VVGFVATVTAAVPAGAADVTASRPEGGAVMVGWHEDGDDIDTLRAHEAELGTRFALVRMYQQWQLPARKVATMINDGRLVLVSHKPPAAGWAAVASGVEDPMIEALAKAYKAFGREVLFTFHHEPHDDASDVKGGTYGTAAEYLAAWRRIRRTFDRIGASHSAGGNVFFAYSATGSWALKSGDPLYPGDDLIDVFAHDRYNWASCRDDAWEEFSTEWAPLVALAAAHRKPLIAAEFGSPPADGARNDWFRRAADWMRTDPLARRWMWGVAYFHSLHDTCPWDFLSQADDGRLGWQDAFRGPYFTGTPFSLASDGSSPNLETVGVPTAPSTNGAFPPGKPADLPRPTTTTVPTTTTTTVPSTTTSSTPPAVDPASSGPIATDGSSAAPAAGTAKAAAPPVLSRTDGGAPRSSSTSTTVLVGLAAVLAGALGVRRLTSV
jgi:hypothetical protein